MGKRQHKKLKSKHSTKVLGALEYMGNINIPTTVELIQYNEKEYTDKSLTVHDDLRNYTKDGYVSWFKITGISDADYISRICRDFGLHSFDIRELLADNNTVKVVLYNDVTFALISGFYLNDENEVDNALIAFILGDDFVISIKESPIPVFKEVEKAIAERNIVLRQKGADFLLYVLLNTVNSFNNDCILRSEDGLWDIEDQLILQQETKDVLHMLRDQRKNFMHFKRFMSSLREEYENLLENSNKKVKAENMVYFENLDDKYRTTSNNLENYEDSVKSLLDLYYNNNAMRMSEIMKRLTLVATIFIPLTFLVGVWGMNFSIMPELTWKYGYLVAWIIFVVIVVAVILLMKKKKWL